MWIDLDDILELDHLILNHPMSVYASGLRATKFGLKIQHEDAQISTGVDRQPHALFHR